MTVHRVSITLPDGATHALEADAEQHLLEAARAAGLDLPYRCLQGWCLTCAARVCQGQVDQRDSRRFYDEDRREGFALLCTGRAASDLRLESHARDAMRAARLRHGLPFPSGDWGRAAVDRHPR